MFSKLLALAFMFVLPSLASFPRQDSAAASRPAPQDQEKDQIRLGAATVQMDVIITDKTGRRVNGLTAADFVVKDEDAPQKIDFFSAIESSRIVRSTGASDMTTTGGSAGRSPLAVPFEGRFIVLLLDDLHLSTENLLRSRDALIEYVNTQLTPNDMVAVMATAGSVGSLQQFTNDKHRLIAAINRIGILGGFASRVQDERFHMMPAEAVRIEGGDHAVLDAVKRRAQERDPSVSLTGSPPAPEQNSRGRRAPAAPSPAGGATGDSREPIEDIIRTRAHNVVLQMTRAARASLNAMASLFKSMGELPGRKVVVLVSETLVSATGTPQSLDTELNTVIDLARRNGVSLYALDAGGLRTNNPLASQHVTARELNDRSRTLQASFSDFENLSAARLLTLGTGGEFIANTNNLAAGLQRAVEDSSTYYVLGFTPLSPPDNKFHRLTVTVKGNPDLVVRTRKGYFAYNEESARGTPNELLAALLSPIPRNGLPLEVVANVLPKGAGQSVTLSLHVGRNYLSFPEAGAADQPLAFDVAFWVFTAGQDAPVGTFERIMSFDMKDPQAVQKLKTEGLLYVSQSDQLSPGYYQIRAVVREKSTGSVGSAYQFFEVPDTKEKKIISISSLLLTPPGTAEFRGHNTFKMGAELDARWVIYNPPKWVDTLIQRVKVVDSAGRYLMDAYLKPAAQPGAEHAMQGTRLKVPSTRGRYSLIVTLQGEKGKIAMERRADFVVE